MSAVRFVSLKGVALVLCASVVFGAAWKHGIPALAGEASEYEDAEEDQRWSAYATDLASASGVSVRYLPPQSQRGRGGDVLNHGGIGFLAIGREEAPTVVVLPMSMLWRGSVASGFEDVGLPEPGKFAQDVVVSAAGGAGEVGLGEALRDTAVLVPVVIREAEGRQHAGRSARRQLARNFPARWEQGAQIDPAAAGAYPASHPRVRALVGWLTVAETCLTAVVLGDPCVGRTGVARAPAGSFAAYCAEELRLPVVGASSAEETLAALREASTDGERLRLSDPRWRRLGPRNWSLELLLEAEGAGVGQESPVVLQASWIQEGLSLTAVAAGRVADDGLESSLELLPLRRNGVVIQPSGAGPVRLRLFFSEVSDPEMSQLGKRRRGDSARGGEGENSANLLPEVDLSASAARSRPARLRTSSSV